MDWRFPISVRRLVTTGRYVHLGWLRRPGHKDREVVSEVMEDLGLTPRLNARSDNCPVASSSAPSSPGRSCKTGTFSSSTGP